VEVALAWIVEVDQGAEVGPCQLSTQCGDNLPVRAGLGKPDHVAEILVGEAPAELCRQPRRNRGHDTLAIPGALGTEDLGPEPVPHLPVEHNLAGIDGLRDRAARCR
jgi:hypothetical protein